MLVFIFLTLDVIHFNSVPYVCFLFCLLLYCSLFFFFKQKTAYELRISDWSSDVCSSDLATRQRCPAAPGSRSGRGPGRPRRRRTARTIGEIGRASCRERVCQYV